MSRQSASMALAVAWASSAKASIKARGAIVQTKNLEESIAGTAANDSNSYLDITDVQPAPADQLALTIATEIGKIYKLQASSDGAAWTDVEGSQFTAAGASEVVNVDRSGGVRLWRAVVVTP